MKHDERGAGTVLVGLVAALVAGLSLIGLVVSSYVVATHRARAAADLAVLAAAHAHAAGDQGCETAAVTARANGAEVATCDLTGSRQAFSVQVVTRVTVRLRLPGAPTSVQARARAGTPASS